MILMAVFYIMLITVNFRFQFARCYRFPPYLFFADGYVVAAAVFFQFAPVCVEFEINLSNDSAIICLLGAHLFYGEFNALIYGMF